MPHPPKSPDSPDLTFICGLGWPKRKMERYFMSRGCCRFRHRIPMMMES